MKYLEIVAVGLAGVALAACETSAQLEPAAVPAATKEAAESAEGVRVLTQTVAWPGETPIQRGVTPLQVRIENNSNIPIDVRYRDLTLLGPEGKRYNAVPPYRIEGSISDPEAVSAFGPIARPAFTYSRFEIAPFYDTTYPTVSVYADLFVYDPHYYDTAYRYWEKTELPTLEMLERAMPEGVVQPGGNVEGWVYFQKIPAESKRVVLRTDIVNSRTGEEFAEVRIPYRVE